MGNDGGSIAGRAELVRPKKKEVRVESELVAKFRAKYCALTKERLRKPVAACKAGYIYNYEMVLQMSLDKKIPKEFKHVSKVRNLKVLNITENPDATSEFPFICPISQISLNGKNKFLCLWSCGCVFSEKILKDLKIKGQSCPLCQQPYDTSDVVELCPTIEEAEMRKAQLFQTLKKEEIDLPVKKKVCIEKVKQPKTQVQNKLETLIGQQNPDIKTNDLYKSLFHKEFKVEGNLFTRNVRYGIR